MANPNVRKTYKFLGTDGKFKNGSWYDIYQIANDSNNSVYALRNRLNGLNYFEDCFLEPLVKQKTLRYKPKTLSQKLSAKWLKRPLV